MYSFAVRFVLIHVSSPLLGRIKAPLALGNESKSLLGGREACVIKRGLHPSHGAEQPIEEGKTDAEVLVHESLVVQHPVMDIVEISRPAEPNLHDGHALHPNSFDMHAIVQVAEDPETPGNGSREEHDLIQCPDPEEREDTCQHDQQNAAGNDPFEANVADGNLTGSRILILSVGTLLLQGTIQKQVMLHVIHTQEPDPAAVQQSV